MVSAPSWQKRLSARDNDVRRATRLLKSLYRSAHCSHNGRGSHCGSVARVLLYRHRGWVITSIPGSAYSSVRSLAQGVWCDYAVQCLLCTCVMNDTRGCTTTPSRRSETADRLSAAGNERSFLETSGVPLHTEHRLSAGRVRTIGGQASLRFIARLTGIVAAE